MLCVKLHIIILYYSFNNLPYFGESGGGFSTETFSERFAKFSRYRECGLCWKLFRTICWLYMVRLLTLHISNFKLHASCQLYNVMYILYIYVHSVNMMYIVHIYRWNGNENEIILNAVVCDVFALKCMS